MKPIKYRWLKGVILWLCLLGCGASQVLVTPSATLPAIVVLPPPTPANSAAATATSLPPDTPIPLDTGWLFLQPGLEQRTLHLTDPTTGQQRETITVLRLDPAFFAFDVAYHPGQPQSLTDWQVETGALLVVNGGYFTQQQLATGLIIVDGQASGVSYEEFGGMVIINEAGLKLRSLAEQPYDSTETIAAALQSFPLLVKPGGEPGFPEEDFRTSRRTVIAQDNQGRVLFLVAPQGTLTLYQLSQWLVNSDLDLHIALNLDGGASTGLLLADPALHVTSFDLLPVVITATSR